MDSLGMLISETRRHFKAEGRTHLPWRKTRDPYKILVSEVMLQQTQVERVVPFYKTFVRKFPNARALARADLSEVLKIWQGLGYNRRAKMLRDAARAIEQEHGGTFPPNAQELDALPGVGPYTARAVAAFAFNAPEVFIETNIRTVFLHHCFQTHGRTRSSRRLSRLGRRASPGSRGKLSPLSPRGALGKVGDSDILPLVERALRRSRMEPREFYAALMDYGSYLKRSGVRLNDRSKHYAKQSKFEGSRRQLRGRILKLLLAGSQTISDLVRRTECPKRRVIQELDRLVQEGLIVRSQEAFSIPV
jgi:A/G-specific adenine glycosylase